MIKKQSKYTAALFLLLSIATTKGMGYKHDIIATFGSYPHSTGIAKLQLRNAETWKNVTPKAMKKDAYARKAKFSNDGTMVAIVGPKNIQIWKGNTLSRKIPIENQMNIHSMAFNPNNSSLAIGDKNRIKLWDIQAKTPKILWEREILINKDLLSKDTDKDLREYLLEVKPAVNITALSFNQDGTEIIAGMTTDDQFAPLGFIKSFNPTTGEEELFKQGEFKQVEGYPIDGEEYPIDDLWEKDQEIYAIVYDRGEGYRLSRLNKNTKKINLRTSKLEYIAVNHDRTKAAYITNKDLEKISRYPDKTFKITITLLDLATKTSTKHPVKSEIAPIRSICLNANGTKVAMMGQYYEKIYILDTQTGKLKLFKTEGKASEIMFKPKPKKKEKLKKRSEKQRKAKHRVDVIIKTQG